MLAELREVNDQIKSFNTEYLESIIADIDRDVYLLQCKREVIQMELSKRIDHE